jgi:DNA-binding LytR/AlgR family response regulator
MKKYNCIIIDDEPLSRELIGDYITDCHELNLSASFANAIDARNYLQQEQVDLLFLDINMPRLSGISLIKSLPHPPAVIFITAYAEYAVEGFELEAIDYLLKPVEQDRFMKAVSRFVAQSAQKEVQPDFIMVKADKKMFRIELDQLLYVEAMGDYIRLVTTDKKLTVYDRLSSFMERLPRDRFCQIHKSYLIALSRIDYLEGNQLRIGDVNLPVSKSYRNELAERLQNQVRRS